MSTSLRFVAIGVAAGSYFKLGCEHGGWYWPLVGYAVLELIALWLECRLPQETAKLERDLKNAKQEQERPGR